MSSTVLPFVIYSTASIGLTLGLAVTLHRNGKVFLAEIFDDDRAMARAINNLLVTGFFMVNLGYAFLISRAKETATAFEASVALMNQLGVLLVSLGVLHFVNMGVIWRVRKNMSNKAVAVPVAPTHRLPPPPPTAADRVAAPALA